MKYNIGDILIRNKKPLHFYLISGEDLQKIRIISYSSVKNGDTCNGYKVKDLFSGTIDKCDYSEGYIDMYYDNILILRKNKLEKINSIDE